MGVLNVGQRIEEQADFEKIYKNGKKLTSHLFLLICAVSSSTVKT